MRLDSARSLKAELVSSVVDPLNVRGDRIRTAGARAMAGATMAAFTLGIGARAIDTVPGVQRTFALGIAPHGDDYRLAIRLQRQALHNSEVIQQLTRKAKGEVDIRLVGRIDKRAKKPAAVPPWYRSDNRPLLIGSSIAHVLVTAGTIGAFVERSGKSYVLSNNHVLANEGQAKKGDTVSQRAPFDGGKKPAQAVAKLGPFVALKSGGTNFVDAALALLDDQDPASFDAAKLRELVAGKDRKLTGLGPAFVNEGATVYKAGRTTGPTKGRITAFDLDNVVVSYGIGNLRFDGQLEIEGTGTTTFSDGGDSGSLIVNSKMEAVALLFAGSDTGGKNGAGLTYANPIQTVLGELKATLLL